MFACSYIAKLYNSDGAQLSLNACSLGSQAVICGRMVDKFPGMNTSYQQLIGSTCDMV